MSKKNIVEVYLEQKKEFIIVLIGLPGSGIEELSIDLSKNLNFNMINTIHYLKNKEITNINEFDIKKLNSKINILKKKGLVICTNFFPKKFVTSKIDFTININISKKISLIKNPTLNNSFYSLYYELLKNTHVNKYINIKNNEDPYNNIFNTLMEFVSCKIDDGSYKNKIICKKTDYNLEETVKKNKKLSNKKINTSNSEQENKNEFVKTNETDSDYSELNTTESDDSELNTTESNDSELNTSESDDIDLNTTDSVS